MENLELSLDPAFWANRRVFLTGHTGFKGGWLALWLGAMSVEVTGYALPAPSTPSLFELAGVEAALTHVHGDVRDLAGLRAAMKKANPEIVIHMAAQALVRASYRDPVENYATNVMGTVHVLEAVRHTESVRAALIVTSDKCYENREWPWAYREDEAFGGFDPYSNSKGCAELVTAAYRTSFFHPQSYATHGVAVASARAGNVVGGGDWAQDRLIPDAARAFLKGEALQVRNPGAIRPWQHVLDPLHGYLVLAQALVNHGAAFAQGWNFGPGEASEQPVRGVLDLFAAHWPGARWQVTGEAASLHEAHYLRLDCGKARQLLNWRPVYDLKETLSETAAWYQAYGAGGQPMGEVTRRQIAAFMARLPVRAAPRPLKHAARG